MDALYSGFSYASSELRRAAKPVIDTLAPILPTFGCGEAAVKQSVSSCIHEMEAGAIRNYYGKKHHVSWSNSFSQIKKLILYPLQDPASISGKEDKCRDSTKLEQETLANVTKIINEQLKSWSIPFRFAVSNRKKVRDRL